MEDNIVGFTIRIPRSLRDQIDSRAALSHRTRNAQINMMLEGSIDESVRKDLEAIRNSGDHQGA